MVEQVVEKRQDQDQGNLYGFDFDFEDIIRFGNISVLITFQFL